MSLVQLHCSIDGKFTGSYADFLTEHIQAPAEKAILGTVSSPIIYLLHTSEKTLIFLLFYPFWTPLSHHTLECRSSATCLRMRKVTLVVLVLPSGLPEMQQGRAAVPWDAGAPHHSWHPGPTKPRGGRWRYLLLHLFQFRPRWCLSLPLSDLSASVANHDGDVQEQKARRRLNRKWGIILRAVGVGLPGRNPSQEAGMSNLLRCSFCRGVAGVKRHTGI